MRFEFLPAVIAGAVGAGPMMMSRMVMMKATGVDLKMNILRVWGSMLGLRGTRMMVGGLVVHLLVSAAIGMMYALGFQFLGARKQMPLWGIFGGLIHWLIAGGMALRMMPAMLPKIPAEMPAPGPFARNFGTPDFVGFLLGHLVYGLAFANIYSRLHTKSSVAAEIRRQVRERIAHM